MSGGCTLIAPHTPSLRGHGHPIYICYIIRRGSPTSSGVPRGRGWGVQTPPPPEIPNVLQNRAKINPIVKTVKNC